MERCQNAQSVAVCCACGCIATEHSECPCWHLFSTGSWNSGRSWPGLMNHVFFHITWIAGWVLPGQHLALGFPGGCYLFPELSPIHGGPTSQLKGPAADIILIPQHTFRGMESTTRRVRAVLASAKIWTSLFHSTLLISVRFKSALKVLHGIGHHKIYLDLRYT